MEELKNFYSGKRVLITGGHGFKGTWLCLALSYLGANVLGYGLKNASSLTFHEALKKREKKIMFVEDNILNRYKLNKIFSDFKPEIVFHLAADPLVSSGYERPFAMFETNIMGTVSVLEACMKEKSVGAFVNVTTDKVYKNTNRRDLIFSEDNELGGDDPYSASKACSELITHAYIKSFKNNIGIATARAGNVIGIGDFSKNRLFPDIIRAEIESKELLVRNPIAIRPWQDVIDPIIGYLKLANLLYLNPIQYQGAYNFGPPKSQIISVKDLINKIISEKIINIPIKYIKNHINEKEFLSLSSEKAIDKLNWSNKGELIEDIKNIKKGYDYLIKEKGVIDFCKELLVNKIMY